MIAVNFISKLTCRKARIVWLVLYALSICSFIDICYASVFGLSIVQIWALLLTAVAFKATALLSVGILLWRWKWARPVLYFGFIVYAFLSIFNIACWGFYGFGISRRLINLISQTNLSESMELVPEIFRKLCGVLSQWTTWLLIISSGILYHIIKRLPNMVYSCLLISLSLAGIVSVLWFGICFNSGRVGFVISARVAKYSMDTYRANREVENYILNMPPLKYPQTIKNTHQGSENIIVIIGESASPNHLGIYDYGLDTTPRMSAMRDSLIVMTDALSPSIYTLTSLENILTFRPDTAINSQWTDFTPIIDLFNHAGVRTYWISNQERAGLWANSIGALTSQAQYIKFVGQEYSEDAMLTDTTYDESLIPPVRDCLSDTAGRRLVFIHLMGSHYKYNKRYPPSHNRFSVRDIAEMRHEDNLTQEQMEEIAAYDNSIAYTDSIWSEIVRMVSGSMNPSLVIYLSDHGENVYDGTEGYRGRDKEHAYVPFVVYPNSAYCKNYPETVTRMKDSTDAPFSTSSLVNILCDVMGIEYALYDASGNPFSPDFNAHQRIVSEFEPY